MPELLLGPMLRYADATSATVWVETDAPATVELLGRQARTFHVAGHHYALLVLSGLEPGSAVPYEVRLDGRVVWPLPGEPPSLLRTVPAEGPRRIVAGSCRVDRPHHPPWTLAGGEHPDAVGHDALRGLANRVREQDPRHWPDLLLLVGDQVYADEGLSPHIARRIRERQDREHPDAPRDEVGDFEEFTWLYQDSWAHPMVRWLMSTVPTAMIFDDHDVRDDWNISQAWREWVKAQDWWPARIHGALMSYWLYQHLGNLSPAEVKADGLLARLQGAADGEPILRDALREADTEYDGSKPSRWSYRRDLGRTRLLVVDSRSGRVVEDGHREMLDDREFGWVEEQLTGGCEHLVLVTSLPLFLTPAIHHAEGFWSALGDGAWGPAFARLAERVRRAEDVEHWAAFRDSFDRLTRRLLELARGRHGEPPADVVVVSGDVHYSYVADVVAPGLRCPIVQLTCSPVRNDLGPRMRRMVRAASRPATTTVTRALARAAGAAPEPAGWRVTAGPVFGNAVATLDLSRHGVELTVENTVDGPDETDLRTVLRYTTAAVAPRGDAADADLPQVSGGSRAASAGDR